MSIIHLSSLGQNPANFTNDFPQQINLAPHSEVRLLGYSGVQADIAANAGRSLADFITIKKDINDCFMVAHGEIADGTAPDSFQQVPFKVTLPEGTYSLSQPVATPTKPQFATVLERALNDSDNTQEFYRPEAAAVPLGWEVTYAPASGDFTIICTQGRNRRSEAGMWDYYLEPNGLITTPIIATTPTRLRPDVTAKQGNFVNKRQGFLGSNGLVLTSANPSLGYTMQFRIIAGMTHRDLAITHGVVPIDNLTVWDQISNTTELWTNRKANIKRDPLQSPNSFSDWVYPNKQFPWVTMGMTISPDTGKVGIILSAMKASNGELKQPANQQVEWFDSQVIDLTAGNIVRLQMSPRYDNATNEYKMVFLVDNGVGTFTIIDTLSFGSFAANYSFDLMSAEHVYHCVSYNPDYISPTSAIAEMLTQNKVNVDPLGVADPVMDTTIVWMPLSQDLVGVPARLLQTGAEMSKQCCSSLGIELGYETHYLTTATASSLGWISDRPAGMLILQSVSPLIITSPTLSIEGYIGAGGGGGCPAPILAVCPLRNQTGVTGFSGQTSTTEWVKLNNASELRLDRLNIKLVDETNREFAGLMPDFSCWLMFRCAAEKQDYWRAKAVGGQ